MRIPGLKSTKYWRGYWRNRKDIDWHQAYFTPEHPHRNVIIEHLKRFKFRSVLEVGCATGANLFKIKQNFPHSDIGGMDWSANAIEEAKKMLPKATVLQVGEAMDIYISDKGADILLSDMCYIYLDKKNFHKALGEARRVARNGIVFCEFHHENWFVQKILKWVTGYNSYNYIKELKKEGFSDIEMTKLTEKDWPISEQKKWYGINLQWSYGYVISARK